MPHYKIKVLFVCLGNICRSPMAQGIFEQILLETSLSDKFSVDSAGIGGWHIGKAPDSRAIAQALTHGVDIKKLRARQVVKQDFADFDYIIAMDEDNVADLKNLADESDWAKISLCMSYSSDHQLISVPDPYYGGEAAFEQAFALIQDAAQSLVANITEQHGLD